MYGKEVLLREEEPKEKDILQSQEKWDNIWEWLKTDFHNQWQICVCDNLQQFGTIGVTHILFIYFFQYSQIQIQTKTSSQQKPTSGLSMSQGWASFLIALLLLCVAFLSKLNRNRVFDKQPVRPRAFVPTTSWQTPQQLD